MFEIGDRIFYPMHGAGEIVNVEKREILGEELEYYVMFIPVGSIRVMVPVKNAENVGLRELSSQEEVDQAFAILADEKTKMPQNWNRRFRLNLDKIKGGDIFEIAAVIRNLILRDREKTLSTGERKMLNTAKQMLISEVVLVLDKNEEEVERLVQETVGE